MVSPGLRTNDIFHVLDRQWRQDGSPCWKENWVRESFTSRGPGARENIWVENCIEFPTCSNGKYFHNGATIPFSRFDSIAMVLIESFVRTPHLLASLCFHRPLWVDLSCVQKQDVLNRLFEEHQLSFRVNCEPWAFFGQFSVSLCCKSEAKSWGIEIASTLGSGAFSALVLSHWRRSTTRFPSTPKNSSTKTSDYIRKSFSRWNFSLGVSQRSIKSFKRRSSTFQGMRIRCRRDSPCQATRRTFTRGLLSFLLMWVAKYIQEQCLIYVVTRI